MESRQTGMSASFAAIRCGRLTSWVSSPRENSNRNTRPVLAEMPTALRASALAIVYTTALEGGADLLTCDAHFRSLPSVALFRKGS